VRIRRLEHFENFLGAVGCEPHGQEMGAVGMEDEKGIKSFVL